MAARRSRSLRTTIVTSVVALFAVVLLLSAGVTTLLLHRALYAQLDADLRASSERVVAAMTMGMGHGPTGMHGGPGRPPGTAAQSLVLVAQPTGDDLEIVASEAVTLDNRVTELSDAQARRLLADADEPGAGEPRTVTPGDGLGPHRVMATRVEADGSDLLVVTGVPVSGVVESTRQAVLIMIPAGLLSLVVAGSGTAWLVRRNLAPLDRVAATARQVSAQPLATGEVALAARVPEADTDPATEVGQVGLALNNLLDTMESALTARHESEQRVRQFVADASHELRTPLSSIRGYAELSRRDPEAVPAGVSHALGRIESESLRMQGLVEDLLLLARLDAGRPLSHDEVDLTLLCLDAVGDARVAGPDHRWELALPEEPVLVRGDEARLRQLVTNLLANARVHTPAGTTVATSVRRGTEGVRLVVADDGPGVPEALQGKVFERFTRGDDSRSRSTGSSGLGLSIVDAVARAHQGSVTLESSPGRTVFTVLLPVDGPSGAAP
ncbi:sensor histidine kinase [Ornithinimicrobium tianjinense]|uniref:histidine kinase n=1 Tax=Ornithinimicrobium tianjinense TaxID=1195761 RepID=A0A917BGE6_9MICO|nr:HAMP domain-containing sensor histidine kinase [Ornithinimicrobium tianjinense]GGF43510.1 two-component sensor histidine kinase [Ornithinimicrobium tianjinense]